MFHPFNVQGPANRVNQVQQLAQNAAQNVLQRQKLRALLSQTLGGAPSTAGGGNPIRGSFNHSEMGQRGDVYRPMLLPGYGNSVGFGHGNPFNGAGTEFGSLPGSDPGQSPQSYGPPPPQRPVSSPPQRPASPAQSSPSGGATPAAPSAPLPNAPGGGYINPVWQSLPGSPSSNLVTLANGFRYDPVSDQVFGGGGHSWL